MPHSVLILNGPNLNMLGVRQPEIYGKESLDDIKKLCEAHAASMNLKIELAQSNNEGELISWVQQAYSRYQGIVINPAGYGHSSIALMDALLSSPLPAIEVHLSNIAAREEFRHHTYTSRAVKGSICGMGSFGYVLALYALNDHFKKNP